MRFQLIHLTFLAAWLPACTAWDESAFTSCSWSCVTNFPNPDCQRSSSSSWESCFCSNKTLIAEFNACIHASSCADSEKLDATELCSSTGPYASVTYLTKLSSQYNEIHRWSTKGGSWSESHSDWTTSGTHTWYDKGPWPTGIAGPWGSGSWPDKQCPGSDWPGWTSSGTWDKSDWDKEWTSWTAWTACSSTTSTTAVVSTTAPATLQITASSLTGSTNSSFPTTLTAVAGSVVTSTLSASVSVVPQQETSGSVGLPHGGSWSMGLTAMVATLASIFLGMLIIF